MDISSIKSQGLSNTKDNSKVDGKKSDDRSVSSKTKSSASGDKLSISSEAQQLSRILSKISSGFYNTPEVLRETAQRIENELKSGNE